MNTGTEHQPEDVRWGRLYKISAGSGLVCGALLFAGMISQMSAALRSGPGPGWLAALQGIWLIVIFKLLAGSSGVGLDLLTGIKLLDLVFLVLVGVVHLGLYAALRRNSRAWSIVAAVQPWLGIALLFATSTAGRSAVMGAALVASLVMLGSALFKKTAAYVGIAASVLLLAGDFSAGAIQHSPFVASLFGAGYVLLVIWFFLVGGRLLALGLEDPRAQPPAGG